MSRSDGLDPVMRRQVWSLLMGDVAQRGTTVLVSSHNLRELEDVCDHVGILSHGKVLLERSLTDLQDNILKLQVVFPDGQLPQLPPDLNVLHVTQLGRVHTLIVRGEPAVIKSRVSVFSPMLDGGPAPVSGGRSLSMSWEVRTMRSGDIVL